MPEDLRTRFLEVMSGVPGPVVVVTTINESGPHGTTVSSFASLSMSPAMIMVALDRKSDLLAVLADSKRFGINVLDATQVSLALTFARKGGAGKFDGVLWDIADGLPRLPQAPGWLACDLHELVDGGDHLIALGAVVDAAATTGRPLTYHARQFGTHQILELGA